MNQNVTTSSHVNHTHMEAVNPGYQKVFCWKSVIAGVLISVMTLMILTVLGVGIGGLTASHLISNEEGGSGLASAAGIWLGVSIVVSLFLGGFFALRVSKYNSQRIGAAHGFAIASLFFILLIGSAGSIIGGISQGFGKMITSLGSATPNLANNSFIQDTIHKALGNASLKSDPKEVAQGLTLRLIQGDVASAKQYYAYQTGQSDNEVDAKVAQLKAEFDQKAREFAEKTADVAAQAGWSLFVTFVLGVAAAALGGRNGAKANLERPLV